MKRHTLHLFLQVIVMILLCTFPAAADEDMRQLQVTARAALEELQQKAAAEEEAARREAELSRERILGDRELLEQALATLAAEVKAFEEAIAVLTEDDQKLTEEEISLTAKLAETDGVIRELVGVVRVNAKDVRDLVHQSLIAVTRGNETGFLEDIADQGLFPGAADIAGMIEIIRQQIADAGAVQVRRGTIIDRRGDSSEADILFLGNFTAAYRLDNEVGFLRHSAVGNALYALSRLPSARQQEELRGYMEGKNEAVPIDISRGGALNQLVRTLSFQQQVENGGPLIWPILFILVAAILIVIERLVFLFRNRTDADGLLLSIAGMAANGDWQACKDACRQRSGKPMARIIGAGLEYCQRQRESMENALQEAILREIPPMERFLSTLAMLAAIAPLLGLLGTVTGMIDTFHVITQHGTGDPRMMSGGISEALVTTMLGLAVAIPIMLVHTLINRTVDNRIAEMEEKAVALVNIVEKNSDAGR